jgi:fatty acid-binding protein DegV
VARKKAAPKEKKPTTSRPEVQTLDVVYKCGHEGQRREIVYPHVGVSHTLSWLKNNVKCGECYAEIQALRGQVCNIPHDSNAH